MKPNGLVFAAAITSHMSIPIFEKMILSSFTRAMLTARKIFSVSLTSFCCARRGNRDNLLDEASIERFRQFERLDTVTTNYLGNRRGSVIPDSRGPLVPARTRERCHDRTAIRPQQKLDARFRTSFQDRSST